MNNEPEIKVAIATEDNLEIELHGFFIYDEVSPPVSGHFDVRIAQGYIEVTNQSGLKLRERTITFTPDLIDNDTFVMKNVKFGIDFHWQDRKDFRYKGALKLIISENKIIAINVLPIELYLESVITSEMSSGSTLEFLKAHAIISRSWVLHQINSNENASKETNEQISTDSEIVKWYDRTQHKLFDVCSDDHCQRYQGVGKEVYENVNEAIRFTNGLVLMYNDELCDARYSKCCGGISEAFENVWQNEKIDYLSSISDYKFEQDGFNLDLSNETNTSKWIKNNPPAFCNTEDKALLNQVLKDYDQETTDFYRWEFEYTQEELSNLIKKRSGIDFGEIIDLIPIERGFSGRIIKLKIVGKKKTVIIGKELEIRKTLSESHLYSSAFLVSKEDVIDNIPGKFILTGSGWGHGVGLCQIGAAIMSEMGYGFDEILLHYFRHARISKIY